MQRFHDQQLLLGIMAEQQPNEGGRTVLQRGGINRGTKGVRPTGLGGGGERSVIGAREGLASNRVGITRLGRGPQRNQRALQALCLLLRG